LFEGKRSEYVPRSNVYVKAQFLRLAN
jgi:hypothetical protein